MLVPLAHALSYSYRNVSCPKQELLNVNCSFPGDKLQAKISCLDGQKDSVSPGIKALLGMGHTTVK